MRTLVLGFLLLTVAPFTAHATDAYVSTTGSGSACTSVAPCLTANLTDAVVTAGGTVHVASGTYLTTGWTTAANGTAGNLITYQCEFNGVYTPGACRIAPNASAGVSGTAWAVNGVFTVVKGFEIDGTPIYGTTWEVGLYSQPTSNTAAATITYTQNFIHHLWQINPNAGCGGGSAAIGGNSSNQTADTWHGIVDRNVVHDVGIPLCANQAQGIYAQTRGWSITNNIVYNVAGAAITGDHDGDNITIENNTVFNSYVGIMVGIASAGYHAATSTSLTTNATTATSSNVLHFASGGTACLNGWSAHDNSAWSNSNVSVVSSTATSVTLSGNVPFAVGSGDTILCRTYPGQTIIANNIIVGNDYGIDESGATGNTSIYNTNLMFGNQNLVFPTSGVLTGGTLTATVAATPGWTTGIANTATAGHVIQGGGDYHLATGSAAIGAANSTYSTSADFDGIARPTGSSYDIGAYQYVAHRSTATIGPIEIGRNASTQAAQLTLSGYPNAIDNSFSMIKLNNPFNGLEKWLVIDSLGQFKLMNHFYQPVLTIPDNGSLMSGQAANAHGLTNVFCQAAYAFQPSSGDAQTCTYILKGTAAAAAATRLTADGLTAGSTNVVNLPFNTTAAFNIILTATDVTTRGKDYTWVLPNGRLSIDANAASTTLAAGTPVTQTRGTVTGAAVVIAADTTLGGISLTFAPPTSNTDTWNFAATINTTEVAK